MVEIITKIKLVIVSLFEKILLGRFSNPLSKVIESIIIIRPELIKKKWLIHEPEIVHFNYPNNYHSFFRKYRIFPERYVFLLKDIIFIKRKGVALTTDYKILRESYGSIRKLFLWDNIRPFLSSKHYEINDDYYYYYLPITGFYHFLLEEVPALLNALASNPSLKILTDKKNKYPGYFKETLEFLFKDNLKNRIIDLDKNIKVKNALITQHFLMSGGVPKKDIELLNKHFSTIVDENSNNNFEKIYISRINNYKRRIENKVEIEKYLRKVGFHIVYMEKFNLKEQIKTVANANFIIAPHGAGLSHIIWNPQKRKKIIEIFPSYIRNDCYASIGKTLGYNYDYIICNKIENKEVCDIQLLESKIL